MAISVVQTAVSGNLSGTAVFGNPVTPGNTVLMYVSAYGDGAPISTSGPQLGRSSVPGASLLTSDYSTSGGNIYSSLWMLPTISPVNGDGETLSITADGGGGLASVIGWEVAGLGSSPSLDMSSAAAAAGGATTSSGTTGAITSASEIVVGGATAYAETQSSPGSPWIVSDTPNAWCWAGYQIVSSAGGSYTWTQTTGGAQDADWAAVVATVKATYSPQLLISGII